MTEMYELKPMYHRQISFYRKANTYVTDRKYITLRSYTTDMIMADGHDNIKLLNTIFSPTTVRHMNDFIRQYTRLDHNLGVAVWRKLPVNEWIHISQIKG